MFTCALGVGGGQEGRGAGGGTRVFTCAVGVGGGEEARQAGPPLGVGADLKGGPEGAPTSGAMEQNAFPTFTRLPPATRDGKEWQREVGTYEADRR